MDTSFALDYVLATGLEQPPNHFIDLRSDYDRAEQELWTKLLKNNKRQACAIRLRQILACPDVTAEIIVSPLVLLEMQEWIAAEKIKQGALAVKHFKAIQAMSVANLGEIAKDLWETGSQKPGGVERDWAYALFDSPIGEQLLGIHVEDGCSVTIDEELFRKTVRMAAFQVGLADILHVAAAHRMKCTHFASTDSDFQRIREIILSEFGISLLFRDEIFSVVKAVGEIT